MLPLTPLSLRIPFFSGSALVVPELLEESADTAPQGPRRRRCEGVRGPSGRVRSFQGRSLRGWLLVLAPESREIVLTVAPTVGALRMTARCDMQKDCALVSQCFDEAVAPEPFSIFLVHFGFVSISNF